MTTLQDLGRKGFRSLGVNPTGAMDETAVRLINVLLENNENEAVLEIHFPPSEILFEKDAVFALGGADFNAELNSEKIENWKIHFAERKSVLKFNRKNVGNRTYLSVKNGFRVEKILGSAGTNLAAKFGGFDGGKLQIGDRIFFNSEIQNKNSLFSASISNDLIPIYSKFPTVRIMSGAEFENLTDSSRQSFLDMDFTITQNSNRMGFRLKGEPLDTTNKKELVSSAVNFGTIQLLPDGQVIILMADHQTSGGYPRIANVISSDLPLAAQLGANDKISFHLVSIQEAENLLLDFEKNLNLLKIGVILRKTS